MQELNFESLQELSFDHLQAVEGGISVIVLPLVVFYLPLPE